MYSGNQVKGMQKVITGLVGLITLWLLFYVFDSVIGALFDLGVNESTHFDGAATLITALPEIIGLLGGIFLIMYVISGFKDIKQG